MIDIDARPEVVLELQAAVVLEDSGRPRLVPRDGGRWLAALGRLVGKPVRVALIRPKTRRTTLQNSYYWAGVLEDVLLGLQEQARETGLELPFRSKDDLHEWFKWKFLRVRIVLPGGEEDEQVGSSAKLPIEAFTAYIEQISAWAAMRGIYVRKPKEMEAA